MKYRIKTFVISSLRTILYLGRLLPVKKNRILFSAGEGRQYGCNPKYIFEKLIDSPNKIEYIWVLNDPDKLPSRYRDKVTTVKFLSLDHILALLTSKVIISNLGIEPFLPKRKNQTVINTWHGGGAYKRVSSDLGVFSKEQQKYTRKMRDLRAQMTDVFLSSCQRFSDVSSQDFNIPIHKFLPTGMPRNDRFFNKKNNKVLRERLNEKYGINQDSLLVLYAPTFRGDHHHQTDIDNMVCCEEVSNALKSRFTKNVEFLFRSHIEKGSVTDKVEQKNDLLIHDLTDYPDMQELLDVCDILITDYSSSIWDFCLTGKPAFLFMPDLDEYMANRGFYTPLEYWPYRYATNIQDFCNIISTFDENENKKQIKKHLNHLGSFENGNASRKTIELIETKINL